MGGVMMKAIAHFIKSFTFWELLKGLSLTGRYLFCAQDYRSISRRKNTDVTALPWPACTTTLRQWRRALYCL